MNIGNFCYLHFMKQSKGSLAEQLKAQLGLAQDYEPENVGNSTEEAPSHTMQNSLSHAMKGMKIVVKLEKKGRAGKQVTLVQGFTALDREDYTLPDEDIEPLAKKLKTRLGVGGTVKDGEIIIQGDHRDKIVELLKAEGFNAKRGN